MLMASFALLVGMQLVPLPNGMIRVLSPAAAELYGQAGTQNAAAWHTLSIHPGATLRELLNFLACLAAFVVVVNHWKTRRQILALARVIIIMACFLTVLAVLQKAFWNGRLYWFYPLDPALQSRIGYIWGPYVNRNHFAGYLEMAIPLAFGYLFYLVAKGGGRQGSGFSAQISELARGGKLLPVVALFVAFVLLSMALMTTLSRGAILGFHASLVVLYLLTRSRRLVRKKKLLILFVSFSVLLLGVFAAWDRIEDRFLELVQEQPAARTHIWEDLAGIVKAYPVIGSGLGTFNRAFPRHQTRHATVQFDHAENDYLELLTDTGAPGALLALVVAGMFFHSGVTRCMQLRTSFGSCFGIGGIAACAAIAVHGLLDFNLRVPANAFCLAVIAALTIAGLSREQAESRSRADNSGNKPMVLAFREEKVS